MTTTENAKRKYTAPNVPYILRQEKRWVTWRYVTRPGSAKPTKVPLSRGRGADSTNPSHWLSLTDAVAEYDAGRVGGRLDGIGFVLGGGWCGLDVDACLDAAGTLDARGELVLGRFRTYSEISPSGNGIKGIFKGTVLHGRKQRGVELYGGGRFFTVTGNIWGDISTVEDCQSGADWLVNEWFDPASQSGPRVKGVYTGEVGEPLADELRDHLTRRTGTTEGRDASGACLRVVGDILHGFQLTPADALDWLMVWAERDDQLNALGHYFPWTQEEITHKLRAAASKGCQHPSGPGWLRPGCMMEIDHGAEIARIIEPGRTVDWSRLSKSGPTPEPDEVPAQSAPDPEPKAEWTPPQSAPEPTPGRTKTRFLKWSDLKKIAASQTGQWIVKDVVEPGTLTVFSGLPYSGKTTILAHLMACVACGRDFLGYETKTACPLLFLNCDRLRERVVVTRIERAFQTDNDHAAFERLFSAVPCEDIPVTLTPVYITQMLADLEETMNAVGTPGIVFIDPLRAAFLQEVESGGENDGATMTRVLSPLKKLARASNWAIIMPHHNNKGRDAYAGSAAIPGNTDSVWNVSRDEGSTTSRLTIQTRDGLLPQLEIVEDEVNRGLRRADRPSANKPTELATFIATFPATEATAITREQVMAARPDLSDGGCRRLLRLAEMPANSPRLVKVGDGRKGSGYRYFRQ